MARTQVAEGGTASIMEGSCDKGWSSNLGVGRGVDYSSPSKRILLRNVHTAHDKDKWRLFVNAVMKLWVP